MAAGSTKPTLEQRRANLQAQHQQLTGRLTQLDQSRAQCVAAIQAVEGALALIAELTKPEDAENVVPLNRAQRRRAARATRKQ